MNNNPLVSIVIPAYNAEKYIGRAIKSALNQTWRDVEIIVVDDGSTDRTAETIKSFKDPRVRYIYQQNKDVGAARNYGIKESGGKYITFLDSDDEYLPQKVAKQTEFLEQNPEYQAVYCDTLQFYSDAPDKLFKKGGFHSSGDIFEELLRSSVINPNAAMIDRDILIEVGMFDERLDFPEDWELWLRIARPPKFFGEKLGLARTGHMFGHIHEGLVKVEMRRDSRTTSEVNLRSKKYLFDVLKNMFSAMSPQELERYNTREILQDFRWKIAILCLITNNREELAKITPEISSAIKRGLLYILIWIPAFLLKPLLLFLWRLYQRRKFESIN